MTKQELQSTFQACSVEPHPSSQALGLALSRAKNALDHGDLPADALPSAARHGLQNRLADLRAALSPATRDQVRAVLATLSDMPTRAETDPAKLLYSFERDVADLSDLPEWALAAAARAYRRGEVGDGHWRPTAGEVAKLARDKVRHWCEEAAKISAVLNARIAPASESLDPGRRKELADMLRAAAGGVE
jgi:hypothetical protein